MDEATRPGPPSPASTPRRRTYRPPKIEQVEIVPGEAMLGFCKTEGGMGAMYICGDGACSSPGS